MHNHTPGSKYRQDMRSSTIKLSAYERCINSLVRNNHKHVEGDLVEEFLKEYEELRKSYFYLKDELHKAQEDAVEQRDRAEKAQHETNRVVQELHKVMAEKRCDICDEKADTLSRLETLENLLFFCKDCIEYAHESVGGLNENRRKCR